MRMWTPPAGSAVVIRQRQWRVEQARQDGDVLRLDVVAAGADGCDPGGGRVTFLSPFDAVSTVTGRSRLRHVKPRRAMARLAALVARVDHVRWPLSLVTAGVVVLPHQIEPALAVLDGARRVLIADDVGLGKTIEAALVIAEIRRRRSDARVLVVAPAALCTQWQRELSGRFHVNAEIADAASLDRGGAGGERGDNPWTRHLVWIASLDFLKQPHVLDGLPREPIDLVVIDEAHLACGASERHEAACAIAARARRVLLLTATPDSGRPGDRVALDRIGALAGVLDPLVVFRRTRADLQWPSKRVVRLHRVPPSCAERAVLDVLTRFERAVLRAAGAGHRAAAILMLSVLRKRALSTSAALALSIDRRLAYLSGDAVVADWMQPSFAFDPDATTDAMTDDDCAALSSEVGLDAARERVWLTRLSRLAGVAGLRDSKLERIARLIDRAHEPVVVFTEFRDSLEALRVHVRSRASVAAVHGGLSTGDQAREIARFLDGGARVLCATDVASQGLNLQGRSRWVVSLDLPWNPVRLTQRAGRVDRIGQSRPVHVTLLARDHPAEDALLVRLAQRVLGAARAFPGGDVLAGALPEESSLRASVIAGEPLSLPGETAAFERCTRWTRPAARLARVFLARRNLIRHERGYLGAASGRPMATRARRTRVADAIAVFSVPLMSGGGEVERHVVGVRLGTTTPLTAVSPARALAEQSLIARARRVQCFLQQRRETNAAREHAVSLALTPVAESRVQAGLFDRRAEQRREAMEQVTRAIADRLARRIAADEADTSVAVGPGRLEMIVSGQPE
jgi:superfamily II DNA or RNA helicase